MIKTLYFMLFVCTFVFTLFACSGKAEDKFPNYSADEFEQFISDENVQLVDVRTVAEYTEGHIAGSLNLNILDETFSANADELLDKSKTVAVYCRSGKRSRKAARLLAKKGFNVCNLDKGIENWIELGKKIEK